MLKICDSQVAEPLSFIYKIADSEIFPDIWKRSHIIPTYKTIIINVLLTITVLFFYYRFVAKYLNSLHTIRCFLYLENNELLTPHPSGFCPNEPCIYQLISIVHNTDADLYH